jgi:hypothetical protein
VTVGRLEVVVSFPSGPLAGEITGWKPVEVKRAGPKGKK